MQLIRGSTTTAVPQQSERLKPFGRFQPPSTPFADPSMHFEVTITGIGRRPLVNIFQAKSAGYAGRLAKDKYGDWITIDRVREIEIQQNPPRETAYERTRRRRRRMTQEVEVKLPTWKSRFTQQAEQDRVAQAARRAAIAESFERKRDDARGK